MEKICEFEVHLSSIYLDAKNYDFENMIPIIWECPFLPRVGDCLLLKNILPTHIINEDIEDLLFSVTGITFSKMKNNIYIITLFLEGH